MADADKSKETPDEDIAKSETGADSPQGDGTDDGPVVQSEPDSAIPGTGDTVTREDDELSADKTVAPDDAVAEDDKNLSTGDDTILSDETFPSDTNVSTEDSGSSKDGGDSEPITFTKSGDGFTMGEASSESGTASEDVPRADSEKLSESTSTAVAPPPQVVKEKVVQRKGGFFPMLLGGVVAAGIGYLYAQYETQSWPFGTGMTETDPFEEDTRAALAAQSESVEAILQRLNAVETAVGGLDLATVEGNVETLSGAATSLQEQVDSLSNSLGLIEVRTVELEKRPITENVAPEAIAAYEREIEALRADVEAQRAEIANIAQEAVVAEQNAEAKAELGKMRSALAEMQVALDRGAPFADSLGTISAAEAVTVPDALSAAADEGVPTLSELRDSFAPAARAALSAARSSAAPEAEAGNRVSLFLREQLGVRSVAPREGGDTDAILSRADAAVRSGDLTTTVAELEALPDVAKTAMQDWLDKAEMRLSVQSAAEQLAQELNKE